MSADPVWDEIYEERTRRGWSARELGRRAGVVSSLIDRAETGRNATFSTTRKVLDALGLTVAVVDKVSLASTGEVIAIGTTTAEQHRMWSDDEIARAARAGGGE